MSRSCGTTKKVSGNYGKKLPQAVSYFLGSAKNNFQSYDYSDVVKEHSTEINKAFDTFANLIINGNLDKENEQLCLNELHDLKENSIENANKDREDNTTLTIFGIVAGLVTFIVISCISS